MYKFRIYRNSAVPSYSGEYVDYTRYAISNYEFEREINPLWDNLAIKWDRSDGRAFFREKLEGDFSLIGDDYTYAKNIRDSSTERDKYRILIISEKISGVWTEIWTGFFSVSIGEWNFSNCSVKFSDPLVFDEYNIVLENMEKEVNLLELPQFSVTFQDPTYSYDEIKVEDFVSPSDSTCTLCENLPPAYYVLTGDDTTSLASQKYTLFSKFVLFQGNKTIDGFTDDQIKWKRIWTYRRDYVIQVSNPGSGWISTGVYPPGSGNPEQKWVRGYLGIEPVDSTHSLSTIPITYVQDEDCCYEETFDTLVFTLNTPEAGEPVTNTRGRLFEDAIGQAFGTVFNASFSINSLILNEVTSPITGDTNYLQLMVIYQVTDIRDTSDPATKAMFSFDDVDGWLKYFNIFWYITESGGKKQLKIEHKKFFDLGLSYDSATIGIDITSDAEWTKQAAGTSVLSYQDKALQQRDDFSMDNTGFDDFVGTPIVYHGNMVNWDDNKVVQHSISKLSTDIEFALYEDNINKDSFLLLATYIPQGVGFTTAYEGAGALTGAIRQNAQLSIANVQNDYWKWGRPTVAGVMNRQYTEFDSVENSITQEELQISYCGEFNPYQLVRTSYGDGRVESASRTLKDKILTLNLSYDE